MPFEDAVLPLLEKLWSWSLAQVTIWQIVAANETCLKPLKNSSLCILMNSRTKGNISKKKVPNTIHSLFWRFSLPGRSILSCTFKKSKVYETFFFFIFFLIKIHCMRIQWSLSCPTGPNQPKSQILYHKKRPLQDFIHQLKCSFGLVIPEYR